MAQINVTVGAIAENTGRITQSIDQARTAGAHLVCFPELAVTGYPPEDLVFHPRFVEENLTALAQIAAHNDLPCIVGFVDRDEDGALYNAAAMLMGGKVAHVYRKQHLPNYGVFDEGRHFSAGIETPIYVLGGVRLGVSICEDIWADDGPPVMQATQGGARILININGSPYHLGKRESREQMLVKRARQTGTWVCYNNLVGGQDELVFDGQGVIVSPDGTITARGKAFAEDMIVADLTLPAAREAQGGLPEVVISDAPLAPLRETVSPAVSPLLDQSEEIHRALILGTRDYLGKNGFQKVVIGLSGGIDSALVAALAAEAVGPDNVTCVYMPSRYSSDASGTDAQALAKNLGVELLEIPIKEPFEAYLSALSGPFSGTDPNEAEENLQARTRGNLLMALSNKFGWLVLTTGNKSEMAVGYSTLYGDMAGGFAVIKDLPKQLVYAACHHINVAAGRALIPTEIIKKAPTAELRENQLDTDSLPPYDILDPILEAYVEESRSVDDIVKAGFDEKTVRRIIRMVDLAEYKRRQAPPGIRITPRAFGRDRRMPITNHFRE